MEASPHAGCGGNGWESLAATEGGRATHCPGAGVEGTEGNGESQCRRAWAGAEQSRGSGPKRPDFSSSPPSTCAYSRYTLNAEPVESGKHQNPAEGNMRGLLEV